MFEEELCCVVWYDVTILVSNQICLIVNICHFVNRTEMEYVTWDDTLMNTIIISIVNGAAKKKWIVDFCTSTKPFRIILTFFLHRWWLTSQAWWKQQTTKQQTKSRHALEAAAWNVIWTSPVPKRKYSSNDYTAYSLMLLFEKQESCQPWSTTDIVRFVHSWWPS